MNVCNIGQIGTERKFELIPSLTDEENNMIEEIGTRWGVDTKILENVLNVILENQSECKARILADESYRAEISRLLNEADRLREKGASSLPLKIQQTQTKIDALEVHLKAAQEDLKGAEKSRDKAVEEFRKAHGVKFGKKPKSSNKKVLVNQKWNGLVSAKSKAFDDCNELSKKIKSCEQELEKQRSLLVSFKRKQEEQGALSEEDIQKRIQSISQLIEKNESKIKAHSLALSVVIEVFIRDHIDANNKELENLVRTTLMLFKRKCQNC